MQARAGGLADGEQTRHGARAVEVGRRRRPSVVRRGRDGDELASSGRAPDSRSASTTFGKRAGSTLAHVEPDRARAVSVITVSMARATSSRGASSSTKRSPSGPCSVAPSPRIASVIRKPSRRGTPMTAVGWNWTNSRSARSRRRACASTRPTPSEPGGLVVRDQSAAAPPVASTVAARQRRRGRPRGRRRRQRSSGASQRGGARLLETSIRGCSATSAESSRTTRRPVALPPAWTTRRRVWPPSRPSDEVCRRRRRRSGRRARAGRRRRRAPRRRAPAPRTRRTAPRPATSVSRRCWSGESSSASAAARPPCAQ